MRAETLALILAGDAKKGDVLGVGAHRRHHGRQAHRRADPALPPAGAYHVDVEIAPDERCRRWTYRATRRPGQTGVEMEALTAVSVACADDLRHVQGGRPRHAHRGCAAVEKSGGKSGEFRAEGHEQRR